MQAHGHQRSDMLDGHRVAVTEQGHERAPLSARFQLYRPGRRGAAVARSPRPFLALSERLLDAQSIKLELDRLQYH
jgi:hypothetical protein